MESELGSSFLFEHDLFRKPVPTFRDHALERGTLSMANDKSNTPPIRRVVSGHSTANTAKVIFEWPKRHDQEDMAKICRAGGGRITLPANHFLRITLLIGESLGARESPRRSIR
jgi:hypothetical protein